MNKHEYEQYLLSDHWQSVRRDTLERVGQRCQICNSTSSTQVHHRTYENIGKEKPGDLTVLCGYCHSLFHHRMTKPGSVTLAGDAVLEAIGGDSPDSQDKVSVIGLPTGFIDLDHFTTGLRDGELIVVGSKAGVGKSSFLMNLARYQAIDLGNPILFVSLEHARTDLAISVACAAASVSCLAIQKKILSEEDVGRLRQSIRLLSSAQMFIDDSHRQTVQHIAERSSELKKKHSIRAVFVDCVERVDGDMAEVSSSLRSIARDLALPVVASTRIASAADRQHSAPSLSDMRHNWPLLHDADMILLLDCPRSRGENDDPSVIELAVAKRRNGPTAEMRLTFLKQLTRFENYRERT